MDTFDLMRQRYLTHDVPWDQPLPPPEIIALAADLPAGHALDLGCGPGRACLYLAQHGWRCAGVDFVPEAIELARLRAAQAGVSDAVRFLLGSVDHLERLEPPNGLEPPYDLAIDVGCMHNLRGAALNDYAAGVARMLPAGGRYLLFAHLAPNDTPSHAPNDCPSDASQPPHGLSDQTIRALFAPAFTLERAALGQTTVGDQTWPSAWYWYRRA
jgi:cyclopropane fatty-acyl-phospholipid synthase-like methyltransferase